MAGYVSSDARVEPFSSVESMIQQIRFDANGLVPAIVQDSTSGQVLMMAWMNELSLRQTIEQGETVFWSRSRNSLWHKGASSGNVQRVQAIALDCDGDTLLIQVEAAGPACHTGEVSCFFRSYRLPPLGLTTIR
jgi:phosphoribosyl-AMP cyclohydrolase